MAIYSIRMRASKNNGHISGAERIVSAKNIYKTASNLINRALTHERGKPESINITIDKLESENIVKLKGLDITTIFVDDYREGRMYGSQLLELIGVSKKAADKAISYISKGASPDKKNMRGAMIIDYLTGKRIEPDRYRGIRASRMDITKTAEAKLISTLKRMRINNPYIREAIVLAAKVATAPNTIAELCWSDDPSYQVGYVASKRFGYVRFPYLKEKGSPFGGRAFFVDAKRFDLEKYINFLEQQAILITRIGRCRHAISWNAFLSRINKEMSFPQRF
ncbi:MAG: 6-carboxyhexanoate--CoA ligase [Nitrospirae bacterium]|nr:6-carboxyhexanoate--CoA ligase [Nitrospirota bacterium]